MVPPVASPPAPAELATVEEVALANRLRPVLLHLGRHLRREGGSAALSVGQLEILGLISGRPGAGINDLAALVGITAPSMSTAVDRLEAAGLAARSRLEPGDRRRVGVSVTPEGARVVLEARSSRTAWLAGRLRSLTAEQRHAVETAIDALDAIVRGTPGR
jgi:DNA-binding MarR family transcriptional regulator